MFEHEASDLQQNEMRRDLTALRQAVAVESGTRGLMANTGGDASLYPTSGGGGDGFSTFGTPSRTATINRHPQVPGRMILHECFEDAWGPGASPGPSGTSPLQPGVILASATNPFQKSEINQPKFAEFEEIPLMGFNQVSSTTGNDEEV